MTRTLSFLSNFFLSSSSLIAHLSGSHSRARLFTVCATVCLPFHYSHSARPTYVNIMKKDSSRLECELFYIIHYASISHPRALLGSFILVDFICHAQHHRSGCCSMVCLLWERDFFLRICFFYSCVRSLWKTLKLSVEGEREALNYSWSRVGCMLKLFLKSLTHEQANEWVN